MRNVFLLGASCTAFGKQPEKSFKDLTRDAYLAVLGDAGLARGDAIENAWFGNCGMGSFGQRNIRGQVCFTPLVREGLFPERVPMINVEGGCATASMAFHGAWKDILSGACDLSLAIGVEKIFVKDEPKRTQEIFEGGIDQFDPQEWIAITREPARVSPWRKTAAALSGSTRPPARSPSSKPLDRSSQSTGESKGQIPPTPTPTIAASSSAASPTPRPRRAVKSKSGSSSARATARTTCASRCIAPSQAWNDAGSRSATTPTPTSSIPPPRSWRSSRRCRPAASRRARIVTPFAWHQYWCYSAEPARFLACTNALLMNHLDTQLFDERSVQTSWEQAHDAKGNLKVRSVIDDRY